RADELFEEGRDGQAWPILRPLIPECERQIAPGSIPRFYDDLARAAEAMGRDSLARVELMAGDGYRVRRKTPEATIRLFARLGRLMVRSGEPESARRLLAEHADRLTSHEALPTARVDYLTAWANAEARSGDRAAAHALLTRALDVIWTSAHDSD